MFELEAKELNFRRAAAKKRTSNMDKGASLEQVVEGCNGADRLTSVIDGKRRLVQGALRMSGETDKHQRGKRWRLTDRQHILQAMRETGNGDPRQASKNMLIQFSSRVQESTISF